MNPDPDHNALPNAFVPGFPKAGTTTIASALGLHPQIFVPSVKETGHFIIESEYDRGLDHLERTYYRSAQPFSVRMDCTVNYLASPLAQSRIKNDLPESSHKFVVVLRDPVARAWSHFRWSTLVGTETLSFRDALAAEPLRLSLDKSGHKANCYRFHSSYGSTLREWQKTFDPSSFHFVRQEDFQDHWDPMMAGIFQFLGVDDSIIIPVIHENEGRSANLGLMRHYHRIPEGIRGRVGSIFNQKQRSELIDLLYRFERKKSADNPVFLEPEIDRKLRLEFVKEIELAQEITGLDLRGYLPSS